LSFVQGGSVDIWKENVLEDLEEGILEYESVREFSATIKKEGGVVATTCQNGTHSLLTSAKLSVDYLVVGITRELNKEPSLYCSSIYINTSWSMLQQY